MASVAVLSTEGAVLSSPASYLNSLKFPQTHTREVDDVFTTSPFKRTEAVPIDELSGKLPEATIPKDIDHTAVVRTTLTKLEEHFTPDLFLPDALWRDLYAMVGSFRTFSTVTSISTAWNDLAPLFQPHNFEPILGTTRVVQFGKHGWLQARFTFRTQSQRAADCSGQIGLVPDSLSGGWKIWFISTMLEKIDGLPNPDRMGIDSYKKLGRAKSQHCDYDCVVVGAGFGGLCLAGRLQAMGLNYLVVEKNDQIGDNWRQRYESARFHTTRHWSELPHGRVFDGDRYGTWLGRDDLAEGYAEYVRRHNINVEVSTALQTATRDESRNIWIIKLRRSDNSEYTLRTAHLVFAVGANGVIPYSPELTDRELFQGTVLHSSEYVNARAWSGLRGVVVGTANTAHDVAEDMLDANMSSVTMVQRGDTLVTPVEWHEEHAQSMYNENTDVEYGDRETMIQPLAVSRLTVKNIYAMKIQADPRFDALEKAGFRVDRGGDLLKNLSTTFGGHYVDVGASKKIADGLIKVKGDARLTGYTRTGLKFSDGSELAADVVVFGTGFKQEFRDRIIEFVGKGTGEYIDDYWRNDAEGEYRGAYKPHGVHGIWYTGGGVTFARFYSRFMAIHIKADVEGIPIQRYKR